MLAERRLGHPLHLAGRVGGVAPQPRDASVNEQSASRELTMNVSRTGVNALAESTTGSFQTEQINHNGPWRDINHVEVATFEWVHFFNTDRPHESLDDLTPAVVEQIHYTHQTPLTRAG